MTECITLVVASVLSQMPGGAIFSGKLEDGACCRVVVTGQDFRPVKGEVWEVFGEWRDSSEYGRQLHCKSDNCRRALPSGALVVPWLQRFPGIGQERARRIVKEFRGDLDAAFGGATPIDRLVTIIAPEHPNLAARLAAAIIQEWATVKIEYATVRWLEEHGVDAPRLAVRVAQLLGPDAIDILGRNPYVLATVLNWRRVDAIGKRILGRQARVADPKLCAERLLGAIDDAFQEQVNAGHTAMHRADLPAAVAKRTGLEANAKLAARIEYLGIGNRAIADCGHNESIWRAPGCALMEDELEDRFGRIARGDEAGRVAIPQEDALRTILKSIEETDRQLHVEQREAVLKLVQRPLGCLVGGAGTGKTTTLRSVVRLFEALGGRVEIAALAGKAALKASESTGRRVWTIFRLLDGLEKRRMSEIASESADAKLPLLDDRTLLVIDEASMVDLGQWHGLLEAMPPGCRLLICGDPMQLPPIGFGLVFHHLTAIDAITARLETIHRQSDASGIPEVAKAIRGGSLPKFRSYNGIAAGVHLRDVRDDEELGDVVTQVATELGGFLAEKHALQIIAPLNDRGDGSVAALNRRFHQRNLQMSGVDPEAEVMKGFLGEYFALGDPVSHLTNDYARGLWNGSLGHVVRVSQQAQTVTVAFGSEQYEFGKKDLLKLGLAYAVTCHRAQGSSAKRVIIPIVETRLLDPSWLYTAVTRAEEQAVLVGNSATIERALLRLPAWQNRITGCNFNAIAVGIPPLFAPKSLTRSRKSGTPQGVER